jgi:hypothetical protein
MLVKIFLPNYTTWGWFSNNDAREGNIREIWVSWFDCLGPSKNNVRSYQKKRTRVNSDIDLLVLDPRLCSQAE